MRCCCRSRALRNPEFSFSAPVNELRRPVSSKIALHRIRPACWRARDLIFSHATKRKNGKSEREKCVVEKRIVTCDKARVSPETLKVIRLRARECDTRVQDGRPREFNKLRCCCFERHENNIKSVDEKARKPSKSETGFGFFFWFSFLHRQHRKE